MIMCIRTHTIGFKIVQISLLGADNFVTLCVCLRVHDHMCIRTSTIGFEIVQVGLLGADNFVTLCVSSLCA